MLRRTLGVGVTLSLTVLVWQAAFAGTVVNNITVGSGSNWQIVNSAGSDGGQIQQYVNTSGSTWGWVSNSNWNSASESNRYEWSTAGNNRLTIETGGAVNTDVIYGSGNTLTMHGGSITGSLRIWGDSSSANSVTIDGGTVGSGAVVDMNYGTVNISGGGTIIAGEIRSNAAGNTAWTITGGSFNNGSNLHGQGGTNTLSISGNSTVFTDSQLNFDAGTSNITVTQGVTFTNTTVSQSGSSGSLALGGTSSFTGANKGGSGDIFQDAATSTFSVTGDAKVNLSNINQNGDNNTVTWTTSETNNGNNVTQSGINNTVTLGGSSINTNNTFSQTGTNTTVNIQDATNVSGGSVTQTATGQNRINITTSNYITGTPFIQNNANATNTITASSGILSGGSTMLQNGAVNNLTFSGTVRYTGVNAGDITQTGTTSSSIMVRDSANMSQTVIAASGQQSTITLTEMTGASGYTSTTSTQDAVRNFLNLSQGANAGSRSVFNITGNSAIFNRVNINLAGWSTEHEFNGIVDMSGLTNTASDNVVTISSGRLVNTDGNTTADASIKGSGTVGVVTYYNINGGDTRYIDNNASTGHYTFTDGGRVYNIFDDTKAKDIVTGSNTASYTDAEDYQVYTLLNMNTVNISGGAEVTVGGHEDVSGDNNYSAVDLSSSTQRNSEAYNWDDDYIAGYQAQISADTVNVRTASGATQSSRLVIHENSDRYGLAGSAVDSERNVINTLNIGRQPLDPATNMTSHVTINQTTIHGTVAGTAQINVYEQGVLHGFGEFTSYTDHNPLRPNLIGNLYIGTGGKIQPYDKTIYNINSQGNYNIEHLMGVIFKVADAAGVGGVTTFDKGSILSTRLFARNDNNTLSMNGTTVDRYFSDAIDSYDFDFTNVWNGARNLLDDVEQSHKVQYDPVFGFSYELIAKREFDIYDAQTDETTYWFQVAQSDNVIKELFVDYDTADASKLLPDANHLFNRDILKSDMLGEWFFTYNDTQDAIILRYRMLAAHPTKGGIAIGMLEPNAREAAKKIDEMRYPFATDYTDLKNWPAEDNSTNWGVDGFDGDIVSYYETYAASHPEFYDNYDADRIKDFEHFLHAIQKEIQDAGTLNHAMRLLHAESYVTNSSLNISRMQIFQNNIQRNGISALFQVEQQNYQDALAQTDSYQSEYGYASVSDDLVGQFVCNPTRFWASGFGNNEQTKKRGTEYGYKSDVYGGAVGVIQEIGDLYIGLTGGYAHSENKWRELKSEAKTDSLMGQVLIGLRKGMGFFEFHADYAYNDHKLTRNVWVNNYQRTATGDYSDHTFGGGFRMGYQKLFGCQWLLVPTVGIQYLRNDNFTGFTEKGPSDMFSRLKMKSGALKRNLIQAPFMARLNRPIAIGDYVLTPEVRAGMTMTFGNRRGNVKYEYLGNPISGRYMKAIGYDAGTFSGQLGTTLELSRFGRFYAAANYDYYFAKRSHNHSYSMQAGMNF